MIWTAMRMLMVMTLLTGAVYPLFIYGAGRVFFPHAAGGSLVERDGVVVGSSLVAQKFTNPRYVRPRPSAADYATMPSGASNLGPTSAKLAAFVAEQRRQWGPEVPSELLFTSGSGLDPHIGPDAVLLQLERVAVARRLDRDQVERLRVLVAELTETPELGFLGPSRVNVLRFNLKMDELFP